ARPQRRGHRPRHPQRHSGGRGGRGAPATRHLARVVRAGDREPLRPGRAGLAQPAARPPARRAHPHAGARRAGHGRHAASRGTRGNLRDAGGRVVKRSKATDARAISHHYDVSNDFYALFLDPLMVYTCAYYRDPDGKLEQAQQAKLDHVCRKLDLRPGESVLDIGCGWGALSMWAARHYGVRAQGVTLSRAQAEYAAERIKREGLEGRCRVDYMDYRDLPPEVVYDKIAAVGVIEHVGIANYPAFFGGVRARLRDGGLYLTPGSVHELGWKYSSQFEFLLRHVFPNGELASISQTLTEMERAGWEIMDVEGLRLHYARTCRHWAERLDARADEARALAGERTYRTWRLYLTCSAVAFEPSPPGLYQVVRRKPRAPKPAHDPRTREPLYDRGPA